MRVCKAMVGLMVSLAFAAAAPAAGQLPALEFLLPRESAVTGRALVRVRQTNPQFSPSRVRQVAFAYGRTGTTVRWTPIRTIKGLDTNNERFSRHEWEALWDTRSLSSGRYRLRATMTFQRGRRTATISATKDVVVNKPPVVGSVTVSPGRDRGEIVFTARGAADPDGQVASLRWDFGDPELNRSVVLEEGSRVARIKRGAPSRTYTVAVTATDNLGAQTTSFYRFGYEADIPTLVQDRSCKCKSINVRTKGNALGPDGANDANGWGKTAGMDDGLKLGPLGGNAENKTVGGEKDWTGFAFEVVAEVDGDPKLCRETQLIKRTRTPAGGAADNKSYSGTGDRDLDGVNDMNITNAASCAAAGGNWVGGRCEFPQSGSRYQPDGYMPSGGSLYDKEYTFKKHQGQQILWYDTPAIHKSFGGNGSTYKADFIAIIRGTDAKYCYVKFNVSAEKKAGADTESLTPVDAAGDVVGTAGAANVPGVP